MPTTDPDLGTWLLAQLDAEAETARAAERVAASPWHDAGSLLLAAQPDGSHDEVAVASDYTLDPVLAHAARQDPQATLDRVEATKLLVAMHEPYVAWTGADVPHHCWACDRGDFANPMPWPCPTLRALAYAYRRQPGWESRWAPEGVSADA